VALSFHLLHSPALNFFLDWKKIYLLVCLVTINSELVTMPIISLPADVLRHHIFPKLSKPSLIALSMVCKLWRKTLSRSQINSAFKRETLLSFYQEGISMEFLQWFERALSFPGLSLMNQANRHRMIACLEAAATGSPSKCIEV
jgi:hypothetical protein